MQIYVDMDGVLVDFDAHYKKLFGYVPVRPGGTDWKLVRSVGDFYLTLPQMPDLDQLWDRVYPHSPIILTGVPSQINAADNDKRTWALKHLTPDTEMICCLAKDKALHCKPGDILIDDYERHKQKWLDAGGIWITHTSALDTCRQLDAIGIS